MNGLLDQEKRIEAIFSYVILILKYPKHYD